MIDSSVKRACSITKHIKTGQYFIVQGFVLHINATFKFMSFTALHILQNNSLQQFMNTCPRAYLSKCEVNADSA